jgi:NAD(P)-dependent dehydrogenase (short-subunit alcohol dehydrogenase family)
MISAQRAPNVPFGRQLRMRSVGTYWNDEHEICRVAAATADTSGKRTRFFWLTQRAVGQMLRQGSGHVVNVSASVADHADSAEPTALAALTKGGLAAVTRSLACRSGSGRRPGAPLPARRRLRAPVASQRRRS